MCCWSSDGSQVFQSIEQLIRQWICLCHWRIAPRILYLNDQWLVSLYRICQTHQVLLPNTTVIQVAYDSNSKAKLPETIIIQMHSQLSHFLPYKLLNFTIWYTSSSSKNSSSNARGEASSCYFQRSRMFRYSCCSKSPFM